MKLVLLGAPGSGKGTQAAYITAKYNLPHISTGDIFRENIRNRTPIGNKIKAIIDAGNFCPDELTVEVVKERLAKPDCQAGYLLDGFPRNIYQAEALDDFCAPDKIINLDVDLDSIEKRITGRRSCPECGGAYHIDFLSDKESCPECGAKLISRADDCPEIVKNRLTVYSQQTQPLVDYYKSQGKLLNVNGNRAIEAVFQDIVKVLSK